MNNDEKQKLMDEVFAKRRSFSNIYEESKKTISETENELLDILKNNQKELDELTKQNFNVSDEELVKLKENLEKDFNTKIEMPEKVVSGKASKEVFDKINEELKKEVIGQDKACDDYTMAFRRPYVIGSDPQKIRNSIILYGPNGTGRHKLVKTMAKLMKDNGLTVSSDIGKLDMSRYQSSSQEALFLQDLYVALIGKNPVIQIENFEEASPIFNRILNELVLNGNYALPKRYNFINGQLQEANQKLTADVIDHLGGNDKTLVFISEKNPTKMMDIFGKSFVDKIFDKVETQKYDEETLKILTEQLLSNLKTKCLNQLEINLTIEPSVSTYVLSLYEPEDGIDSLAPVVNKIYDELVDIALKKDNVEELTLYYEDELKVKYQEEVIDLSILDDNKTEREEIQKELDEVVGLEEVKEYLLSLENLIKVNEVRRKKGLKTPDISKHMIFTGNPGTGKTTIARLVSRMMKACGILKQGQLVEVTRADLVGKYVGHTAPLTMDVINSALGGVLFIDEAYSLYRGKDDSFGLEAIDTLVKAMEDHRDDLIVILAGYSKEMKEFLNANSGLKSRFANIIQFNDYTGEELVKIAKSIAKGKDYKIDPECDEKLLEFFNNIQAKDDPNSGNGRLARNLVEDAILHQSKRVLQDENADMSTLKLEDFDLTRTS